MVIQDEQHATFTQLRDLIERGEITDIEGLNAALWTWVDQAYHQRVHTETGATPTARLAQPVRPVADALAHEQTPTLTPRALYRCLADQLGLPVAWSGGDAARAVRQALLARREAGAVPLLILDEADALPLSTLGELRVLQNAEMDHRSPTAVVLIGAPLLRQHLRLQQLAALEDVFHLTRGVPGLINRVCQTAMLVAAGSERPDVVEPRTVKAAAMDCGLA